MAQSQKYRIVYCQGQEIGLSTKMTSGRAWLEDTHLYIEGPQPLSFDCAQLQDVEIFRQHGIGRMIRFEHGGSFFFLTVVRLDLFGFFVIINFMATGKLFKQLSLAVNPPKIKAAD